MGLEDVAMFRALPTATIFYPCDGVSTEKAVELAATIKVRFDGSCELSCVLCSHSYISSSYISSLNENARKDLQTNSTVRFCDVRSVK